MAIKQLLPNGWLGAFDGFIFSGATIIGVVVNIPVLLVFGFPFGGNAHTASSAPDKAAEDLRAVVGVLRRFAPCLKRGLNFIKKLLGNYRLVIAFVKLAAIAEVSIIKRIR
ncbi:MAG: hypothetical protein Q7K16_04210 [Candidatus Azambacteria bacterium]|nr:hypothetical protein [Candidatus Azambacteria bacterium]